MAKQFLDCPQIAASGQQVRRKGMPEGVRCRGFRQVQPAPCQPHGALGDTGLQAFAPGAEKQRLVRAAAIGATGDIIVDGGADGGQYRHDALLVALAGDGERLADRQRIAVQRQCLADAQTGAVQQRDQRDVAGGDPGLGGEIADGVERLRRFGPYLFWVMASAIFAPSNSISPPDES